MKRSTQILLSLLAAMVLWAAMTWPLPLLVDEAIPSHHRGGEPGAARVMIPGDHIQLMYHFDLFRGMLTGETPWFQNVYEFNTGDDEARQRFSFLFFPFSAMYAAGCILAGPAFGWNLAMVAVLALTFFAHWKLAGCFTRDPILSALAALPALFSATQWAMLCNGSPSGFGMMWPPLLCWLLASTVRTARTLHAVVGGLAWAMASWGDIQVTYFMFLLLPLWGFMIYLLPDTRQDKPAPPRISFWRMASRVALFVGGGLLGAIYLLYRTQRVGQATMSGGRSLAEVAIYSPHPSGVFSHSLSGIHNDLFLGVGLLALLALSIVRILLAARRKQGRIPAVWMILLFTGMLGLFFLALGTQSGGQGLWYERIRQYIPKLTMIRQPTKALTVLPCLLTALLALGLPAISRMFPWRRPRLITACLLLPALLEHLVFIHPVLTTIERTQPAYQAMVEDAATKGIHAPRTLAIPLWPGDSAWSSKVMWYNQQHGLRGVNGYSPVVARTYVAETFEPLRPLNMGLLEEPSLARLWHMGVNYVVVHEDAFPEKVSPYPVAVTLARFLNHPHLELLAQHGSIWAFYLRTSPRAVLEPVAMDWYFAARRHEAERLTSDPRRITADALASGGQALILEPGQGVLQGRPSSHGPALGQRVLLRVRGDGAFRFTPLIGGRVLPSASPDLPPAWENVRQGSPQILAVNNTQWKWIEALFPVTSFQPASWELAPAEGRIEIDMLAVTAGKSTLIEPSQTLTWPTAAFFHAGHSTPQLESVTLRPHVEPADVIVYGPELPLHAGKYTLTLSYSTETADRPAGMLRLRGGNNTWEDLPLLAPGPVTTAFQLHDNLPRRFEVRYSRSAEITLHEWSIRRIE